MPEVNERGECVQCGKVRVPGDTIPCPHHIIEGTNPTRYFQDQIPGGMVLENGFPEPVTVYSWSEMETLYKQHGLTMKEKWCPAPGTDVDPAGIQNPDRYKDPYTLRAGAALMLRQQGISEDDDSIDFEKLFIPRDAPISTDKEAMKFLRKSGEYRLCPTCQGVKEGCKTCNESGLIEVKRGKRRQR